MAYNTSTGSRGFGDIDYQGDPSDVQIDFDRDYIAFKTNATSRLIISGSGHITASLPVSCSKDVTASGLYTATTTISSTHISSSLHLSASKVFANGVELTAGTAPAIDTYNNEALNRILVGTATSKTVQGATNLTFNGSQLNVAGELSASKGVTGSHVESTTATIGTLTATTIIGGSPLSISASSIGITGSFDVDSGTTTYAAPSGAVGYTIISESGSYTSGSKGVVDITPGLITVTASSPALVLHAGNLEILSGEFSASHGITGSHVYAEGATIQGTTHLSGGLRTKYIYKTADYNLSTHDRVVIFNASVHATGTLPILNTDLDGVTYTIKNIGTGPVRVTGSANTDAFIDGEQQVILATGDAATVLGWDGASGLEWTILNFYNYA